MKKEIRLLLLTLTLTMAATACGPSESEIKSKQQAEAKAAVEKTANKDKRKEKQATLKPKREALLADIKSNEPKIKDASWLDEDSNSLTAGVLAGKGSQDGYAQYLCSKMSEHQLYGGIVRVMDVAAATRGEWKELGKANCPSENDAVNVTLVEFGPKNTETKTIKP